MAASEAAAMPFPREETTPPVINMYLVMGRDCTAKPAPLKTRLSLGNQEGIPRHRLMDTTPILTQNLRNCRQLHGFCEYLAPIVDIMSRKNLH
jgi:hypothetical protein